MPVFIIPPLQRAAVEKLTSFTEERVLRGDYGSGTQLHINYHGAVYHAVNTQIPMEYAKKKVVIEVDPDDLRMIKLFIDGVYFCDMIALGEYGRIRHTLKTRKIAQKLQKERMTPDSIFNPNLAIVVDELEKRGKTSRRARTQAANIKRDAEGKLDKKQQTPEVIGNITELMNESKRVTENESNSLSAANVKNLLASNGDVEMVIRTINSRKVN